MSDINSWNFECVVYSKSIETEAFFDFTKTKTINEKFNISIPMSFSLVDVPLTFEINFQFGKQEKRYLKLGRMNIDIAQCCFTKNI